VVSVELASQGAFKEGYLRRTWNYIRKLYLD
jgi:hypothetical protein